VPPKNAFDDFDDFDDLEDAKEGDLDDDFANISVHDRSNLDDFNPMFDSPAESKSSNAGAFGNSNGFTFAHSPSTSLSGPPATASTAGNTQDEHDWDAIFAGIDKPGAAGSQGDALAAFDFGNGNGTSSTTTKAPERPEIGRALTQGGEHDDPILKNLTGMGYSRQDALAALEKYDYNLERV
jgi:epidermal growth factor receptor substrate 15